MRKRESNIIVNSYNSVRDCVRESRIPSQYNVKSYNQLTNYISSSDSWYWKGVRSYTNAIDIVDGKERIPLSLLNEYNDIKSMISDEVMAVKNAKRRLHYGDQGDELLLERLYSGDTDTMWRNTVRERTLTSSTRHIIITCNIGGNCYVSSSELFYRVAYAISLAFKYEDAGYSVRLIGYSTLNIVSNDHEYSNRESLIECVVGESPLAESEILCTLGFPGFFRTVFFGISYTRPYHILEGIGYDNHYIDYITHSKLCEGDDRDSIIAIPNNVRDISDIVRCEKRRQNSELERIPCVSV